VELLVVIAIVGVLVMLLLPAVQSARESARRTACANQLRQLGIAVHTYETGRQMFPAGFASVSSVADRDVWNEAENGTDGHSWILDILPFLEQKTLYDRWDFTMNVKGNAAVAQANIVTLYCPSRRAGVRSEDVKVMFMGWGSGGTDYGGCAGNSNYWNDILPSHKFEHEGDDAKERGVFGQNDPRRAGSIRDGMSTTLMLGELQRIFEHPNAITPYAGTSHDGWAVGGVATLVDTDSTSIGKGRVNGPQFETPGSDHPRGAMFCFADGAVDFLGEDIDTQVMEDIGSIAGRENVPAFR
jgi:type II secretory pathway pseudopilin PulG